MNGVTLTVITLSDEVATLIGLQHIEVDFPPPPVAILAVSHCLARSVLFASPLYRRQEGSHVSKKVNCLGVKDNYERDANLHLC